MSPNTVIHLADLGFEIGKIVDLADGQPMKFDVKQGSVQLDVSVPFGETRLLCVMPKPADI